MCVYRYRCFLILMLIGFSLSGNDVENQLIEAEEYANQKWGDVQSALDRRAKLIPDLLLALGETNTTLNSEIESLKNQLSSAKGEQKMALEKELEAKMSQAKLYLKNGVSKSDIIVQIEGAENRINYARKEYNKAAKTYNVLLKKNKSYFPNYKLKSYFE
ncbi:MAG TPA: hypothetical protein EYG85_05775 [Crocinitomix sp.]|nr:hypothetical protein [Crocinitomix sp.]